jgi:ubiquinone/menaquinone biosynthesis C-methylase UbiE
MPTENNRFNEPDNISRGLDSQHFSQIAKKYRKLRTTDSEPISVIVDKVNNLDHVEAVDVGCGDGRYDLLFFKKLGDKLNLTCLDANVEMLASLSDYLAKHDITNFSAMRSTAEAMPFNDSTLDCVFTFNAVHHFDLPRFLAESARVIKSGGYLFIYTRLREQNERNIWGRHFPLFNEKENRLYTLDIMKQSVEAVNSMRLESVVFFSYNRISALEQLIERARDHHYSTFARYSAAELEKALEGFSDNISNQFKDKNQVQWFDENVLFIIKIEEKTSLEYLKIAAGYRPPGMIV